MEREKTRNERGMIDDHVCVSNIIAQFYLPFSLSDDDILCALKLRKSRDQ